MKKMPKEIKDIVILGGGTAGWMTAAALIKLLPSAHFKITLIESDSIGTVGVGEATLPHLGAFNRRLGIDEAEFMRATQATFKVGIEFQNWGQNGDAYIHPFGDYGYNIAGVPFHHFWTKEHLNGDPSLIDDYSLPVKACQAKKFTFPSKNLLSIDSTYSYAYHIDAGLYAKFLRQFSENLGATRIEGKVVDVITRTSDQHIETLILDDNRRINADFFVDCTGFRAQLIEQVYHSGFVDWSHWLPCNSAIAIATQHTDAPLPYTKAIAREAGWQWQIPLQHRIGNGYVYCDKYINKDQALETLCANLTGRPITEPNFLKFQTGRRKKSWIKNCLAVGLSSGFLEPLESTSIYLIQSAIMKLVDLIPQENNIQIKADEYNRSLDMEMERIRDFLILHYHATERSDTPFWDYIRTMDIPDSLKDKMDMFKASGHVQNYRYGLFLEPSWVAVYMGQRFVPESYDQRVNMINRDGYIKGMQQFKQDVQAAVIKMPEHSNTIHEYCTIGGIENDGLIQSGLYGNRL